MSGKRAISFVLAIQFFCGLAANQKIVRHGKVAEVVEADGSVHEVKSQPRRADASEEVFASRVQGMLEDVENMASAHVTPEKSKIKTIKDIVKDDLIPDLMATRKAAADQVTINLGSIDTCNSNALSRLSNIKSSTESSVNDARSKHADCREAEKEKTSTKSNRCKELDDWLAGINDPQNQPSGRGRKEMVQYVKAMSNYYCPKGPEVTTKDEACATATKEHAEHKSTCDGLQATFESGFCTWRTELNDACVALGDCYEGAKKTYEEHKTETTELVAKWKTEYAALKKIECYVDVWLSDNNEKTVSQGQFDKCRSSDVDTSAMDVDFGTPADKAQCSLDAVQNYPGTDGFVSTEYEQFKEFAVQVVACLPLGSKGTIQQSTENTATAVAEPATPTQVYSEEGLTKWTGWSDNSGLQLEGRYCHGKFTGAIEKTIENLPAHKEVSVKFRYYALESWDPAHPNYGKNGNEVGRFYADGTVQWQSKSRTAGNCKNGWLDMSQNFGSKGWKDCYMNVEVTFAHTGGKLSLKFDSNLDQNKNDEAWAMDNLMVTAK